MGIFSIILLVFFVIICLLIIFLVLLQNEEGDSIGGLFAGGSNSAFGSRSGNVLTKATYVMVSLFFLSSFFLAFLNKSGSDSSLSKEAQMQQSEKAVEWWDENTDKDKTNKTEEKEQGDSKTDTETVKESTVSE